MRINQLLSLFRFGKVTPKTGLPKTKGTDFVETSSKITKKENTSSKKTYSWKELISSILNKWHLKKRKDLLLMLDIPEHLITEEHLVIYDRACTQLEQIKKINNENLRKKRNCSINHYESWWCSR